MIRKYRKKVDLDVFKSVLYNDNSHVLAKKIMRLKILLYHSQVRASIEVQHMKVIAALSTRYHGKVMTTLGVVINRENIHNSKPRDEDFAAPRTAENGIRYGKIPKINK